MQEKEIRLKQWYELKTRLATRDPHYPTIHEGEVWWCALGENIGVEMNGKSNKFSRPVLIYKKHNNLSCTVIPLTTQEKTTCSYVKFYFHGRASWAALLQVRTISTLRLYSCLGRIDDTDLHTVQDKFMSYYQTKFDP